MAGYLERHNAFGEANYLVLEALYGENKHRAAILKSVNDRSGEIFNDTTITRHLYHLSINKQLKIIYKNATKRFTTYSLTDQGLDILALQRSIRQML